MSNQPEYEEQQPQTATPEEVRQILLAELEASKQAIQELNEEQLGEIAGGGWIHDAASGVRATYNVARDAGVGHLGSVQYALSQGVPNGIMLGAAGVHGSRPMIRAMEQPPEPPQSKQSKHHGK